MWHRLNAEYAQQFGIETPSLRLRKQAQEYEEAKQIQQALMPEGNSADARSGNFR